jgi:hypothetical protein
MGLYIGSAKQKLILNGETLCLNIPTAIPITNGDLLLSSDDYILKDMNGLYLTVKKESE